MDIDAFVAAHRAEWERLRELLRHHRLSGRQADELVDLYQRVATHLSTVRSSSPDPALVGQLSTLVARARSAVTGARTSAWADLAYFALVSFPAVAYRARRWWLGTAAASVLVMVGLGVWVGTTPSVAAQLMGPRQRAQFVHHEFVSYYSNFFAGSFGAQVWTNNVVVSAIGLGFGIVLGLPTLYMLWANTANVGVSAGLMFSYHRGGTFFAYILPHGMLELTAVFLACGVGLRLGWTVIDPGPRRRADALAAEGRAAIAVALGLVVVLAVSGALEAFVTPSGLPTWTRIGIGAAAEVAFLCYVTVLGRRAVNVGEIGDQRLTPDTAPVAG